MPAKTTITLAAGRIHDGDAANCQMVRGACRHCHRPAACRPSRPAVSVNFLDEITENPVTFLLRRHQDQLTTTRG